MKIDLILNLALSSTLMTSLKYALKFVYFTGCLTFKWWKLNDSEGYKNWEFWWIMVSRGFRRFGTLCFINRKDLRYWLKIGYLIIPYTKRDSFWSFWCQGWSNHQNEEIFWGNRAVEAVEASEVAEADEANEAAEVSKGSKITSKDLIVIQVLKFGLFWCFFDVLKKKVFW